MTIYPVVRAVGLSSLCALLCLAGCNSVARLDSSNASAAHNQSTGATPSGRYGMAAVPLRPEDLTSDTNPGAKFEGCWYKQGKNHYQAVDVSVTTPGTYPFNAKLYYGTTCDPNTQADQFGFGQEIYFGSYIFWFDAFANRENMSALWQVGSDTSKCVDYKTAPVCP